MTKQDKSAPLVEVTEKDLGKPVDGELDKFGRKFIYYHGTNAPLGQILSEGLMPGSDGILYLSLREDFAANYGKTMLKVRLPYELERNPYTRTINGEVRTVTPISPEHIEVIIPATDLTAHLQTAQVKSYRAGLNDRFPDMHTADELQAAVREAEERAARKIQAAINAHRGLNSDAEVLSLIEASLQVLDKLEAEAPVNQGEK